MSQSKLFDYNSSFSVIRTNPKLSGNFKITVDSSGGVWFNSMDVNQTLSSSRFKKFNISGENSYPTDLFNYFDRGTLPTSVVFQVGNFTDGNRRSSEGFSGQYDFFYGSGASVLVDKNYTENFSYFQPLWIKNEIPDFFVIFKVPGPLSYTYAKNQTQISAGVSYKVVEDYTSEEPFVIQYGTDSRALPIYYGNGETFTGTINGTTYTIISGTGKVVLFDELVNLPLVENIDETFRKKILPNCSVVKTFDLRESTKIGKYIRSIFNDPGFSKSPLEVSWGSDSYTYFKGVSYSDGVFSQKGEQLNSFLTSSSSDPMIDLDDYITSGFYRNGLICPNLLNLEFLFNDPDSDLYTINRYMGFYVSRNDLAEFRLNGEFLFKYKDAPGNSNLPRPAINNVGYYDSNLSNPISSSTGVRLYYEGASGYLPGSLDVNDTYSKKLFYVTDKNDNFYSLKRIEDYSALDLLGSDISNYKYGPYIPLTDSFGTTGSFMSSAKGNLVISNKEIDLLNFTGSNQKVATVPGTKASKSGNPYAEIEFLKNWEFSEHITFKIYWPNGSVREGSRKYDLVKSGDFSSILIWIGGSYYSTGNAYYFNALSGTTQEVASAFSSVLEVLDTSTWDTGTNSSSTIIRAKNSGTATNKIFSISVFDDYDSFFSRFKGVWSNNKAYSPNEIVIYDENYYYAKGFIPTSAINQNDSPNNATSSWERYHTFSKSGYLKINGTDASELTKNVRFFGGSNNSNCRVIFDNNYSSIVKAGDFINTKTGVSEILEITKYVDDPVRDSSTGQVTSFNNFGSLLVANLVDQNSIIDLGSDKSFNVYISKKNKIGVFTFFDSKEFDFDFWSSEYSTTPTSEAYRYYQLLENQPGVIRPDMPYFVKSGQISYGGSIYNAGSFFYGVSGSTSFINSSSSINTPPVVFPAQYSNVKYSGLSTYSNIDYYSDLNTFPGFIGIQSIMSQNLSPFATKLDTFNYGKLNTEYEYLQENYTTERSNISRVVPYINKWSYSGGTDARGNGYRLNSSPAFTPLNFSPSLERIEIDPRYLTMEWLLLEQPPRDFLSIYMSNQKSYLAGKIDMTKARSADPANSLYLSSYFTVEPEDYASTYVDSKSYTKELFTFFTYNPASTYYETVFRGVKVVLKKRSPISTGLTDRYVPNYRGYEDYKFSAILRVIEEDNSIIQAPVSYEVIENNQQKFVLFVCNLVIKDQRLLPLGSTGGTGYILDYLTLYSAKNKTKITSSTFPIATGEGFISIDDIKLSSGLDLSLASGSVANTTLITGRVNIATNPDYDTDLREEINLFYVANALGATASSIGATGLGSFRSPAISTTYPWPTGVGPSFVTFGQISSDQNYIFDIPFSPSSPATVPIGPQSIYRTSPVFQVGGGEKYFAGILKRCTAAYIAQKINLSSDKISYTSYSWNSQNSSTDSKKSGFELYLESPTKIVKVDGTSFVASTAGPQELSGASKVTNYVLTPGQSRYASILVRYSGNYEPIFRKIIHFDKDKTDSISAGVNQVDLSYRNCNFASNKYYFGVSRNLSYTKVSLGLPILALSSSLPEGPVYPLVGQTPIAIRDFNLFSSSWDPGYYRRFVNATSYESVAGTRSMKEYKTFFGSKIMKTPDSVNAPNYITLEISRTSGTSDVSSINSSIDGFIKSIQSITDSNSGTKIGSVGPYLSGLDYDKIELAIFPNAEIVWQYFSDINRIKGIIRLDRILRRYLLNSGIKQVFIDNIISEFGVGDPSSINDDVNTYIDLNVSPIYQGGIFNLYVKKTANLEKLSPTSESVRGDLSYNGLINDGYILDPNYTLTMVDNLIYLFEYSLEQNYNYSIQFDFSIIKI